MGSKTPNKTPLGTRRNVSRIANKYGNSIDMNSSNKEFADRLDKIRKDALKKSKVQYAQA